MNGGYGPWTKWSKCSKTCGGGTQKRSRKCNKPKPVGRGKKCNVLGPNKETQECETQSCVQCKYLSLIGAMVSIVHRMLQQLRSYLRQKVLSTLCLPPLLLIRRTILYGKNRPIFIPSESFLNPTEEDKKMFDNITIPHLDNFTDLKLKLSSSSLNCDVQLTYCFILINCRLSFLLS